MTTLPTSLIVVGLVAAWLVVLVPMVARRREHVPESDEDSAGFRVLRRASESLRRRRPVFSRTAVRDADAETVGDDMSDADFYDDDREPADGWDDDGVQDDRGEAVDSPGSAAREAERDPGPDTEFDEFGDAEDRVEHFRPWDAGDVQHTRARDAGEVQHSRPRAVRGQWDAATEWESEHAGRAAGHQGTGVDRPAREYHERGPDDESRLRPVPVRPGRGGFDPDAAAEAKAYRYRRRRRIALVLLAATAVFSLIGALFTPMGWAGAAVTGVLLVLYFAYLRRQVRIEESIRQRRAARWERARQIRPEYRPAVAAQVRGQRRSGALPRPVTDEEAAGGYRVVSHARPSAAASVPPSHYGPGVVVDLDDDDPAFDDLEYYRPVTYRRAVGE